MALQMHYCLPEEAVHESTVGTTSKKMFLDIPHPQVWQDSQSAFRRIIEEERIRIGQIGRKFFIMGADFERLAGEQEK